MPSADDTLRDLCRHGTTLVQVTHRIDTIIPEMKRVLFLDKGRIVGDGTPAEMLTSTKLSALYGTSLTWWKPMVSTKYFLENF